MAKHTHFFGPAGSGKTFNLDAKRKEFPGSLFIDDFDPETPTGYLQANRVLYHLRQGIDVFTAGVAAIRRSDGAPVDNVGVKRPAGGGSLYLSGLLGRSAFVFPGDFRLPESLVHKEIRPTPGKHTHFHGPKGSGKSLLVSKARRDDPKAAFFKAPLSILAVNAALKAGQNVYTWSESPLVLGTVTNVKSELPAWAAAQQLPGLKAEVERLKAENAALTYYDELGKRQLRFAGEVAEQNAAKVCALEAENKRLLETLSCREKEISALCNRLNNVQAALN